MAWRQDADLGLLDSMATALFFPSHYLLLNSFVGKNKQVSLPSYTSPTIHTCIFSVSGVVVLWVEICPAEIYILKS